MKFKNLFNLKKTPIKNIEESEGAKVDGESQNNIFESENTILDREYYVGKYKLILKDFHVFDIYQKMYPLYDQFLPFFVKNLTV